ncbi:Gfo/Idh/MocA family protein [Anseongella ginsenosidimutans]|uniref:Gfo/Idh/MocA family protein n=1 Tax=Anseongella ginsenosidimutans TaxID=496056 RepID=UPI001CEFAAD9|nr:Gfo/Idh/MocA family oxidoreductase [Anseongella ginsenosidimutans]
MIFAGIPCLSLRGQAGKGPSAGSEDTPFQETQGEEPLRLAIARITHGHAAWIFGSKRTEAVKVVGIYEPDTGLARQFREQYDLPASLFYSNLDTMLEAARPEAVAAFGAIYEHLEVVESCAPRGIHVMVEKPLATNVKHALRMELLARENQIHLLTNYETSWYPTTEKTFRLLSDSSYVGDLKKVVVHAGHQGPQEIGVGPEFLEWLTDPVLNGGGALIDFGCYGANLMTYLMQGRAPVSVTAITRQYKPKRYPKVDDDATIILNYPDAQCIIQASWNWPFNRKDMAVYGDSGYIITKNDTEMRVRNASGPERSFRVTSTDLPVYENPFVYLADVIRGKTLPGENGLYSLKTNVTVVRILEAARESAEKGKTVYLQPEKQ